MATAGRTGSHGMSGRDERHSRATWLSMMVASSRAMICNRIEFSPNHQFVQTMENSCPEVGHEQVLYLRQSISTFARGRSH